MAVRTCRVGLHGRNAELFQEVDYQVVRQAHIETIKMMSLTKPEVFKRLQSENPGIEFIVRLWDDRMGTGHHPTPEQLVLVVAGLLGACQLHTPPQSDGLTFPLPNRPVAPIISPASPTSTTRSRIPSPSCTGSAGRSPQTAGWPSSRPTA